MKKIIALVLALVMVLSLGTVASAATGQRQLAIRAVVADVATKLLEGPAKTMGAVMQFNKAATVNAVNNLAPVVYNAAKGAVDTLGNVVSDASWLVELAKLVDENDDVKKAEANVDKVQKEIEKAQQDAIDAKTAAGEAATDATTKEGLAGLAYDAMEAYYTHYTEGTGWEATYDDAGYQAMITAYNQADQAWDDAVAAKEAADEAQKVAEAYVKKLNETDLPAAKLALNKEQNDVSKLKSDYVQLRDIAEYAGDIVFETLSVEELALLGVYGGVVGSATALTTAIKVINKVFDKNIRADLPYEILMSIFKRLPSGPIIVSGDDGLIAELIESKIPAALIPMFDALDYVTLKDLVDPNLNTNDVKTREGEHDDLEVALDEVEKSGKSYVATMAGKVVDLVSNVLTDSASYKMIEPFGGPIRERLGGVVTDAVFVALNLPWALSNLITK